MTKATIDDGGSAFPCEGGVDSGLHANPGMSVREYFAGQALAGFCANNAVFAANNQNGWELMNASARDLADRAFWIADNMIAAGKAGA